MENIFIAILKAISSGGENSIEPFEVSIHNIKQEL